LLLCINRAWFEGAKRGEEMELASGAMANSRLDWAERQVAAIVDGKSKQPRTITNLKKSFKQRFSTCVKNSHIK
jgi:hypothetical protein